MSETKRENLDAVCRRITGCRTCDFFKKINDNKIPFVPDSPLGHLSKIENGTKYKVLSVGINPGLNADDYQKNWKKAYEIYKSDDDYEDYKKRILEDYGKSAPYRYDHGLTSYFNLINDRLNIYDDKNINANKILDYVFWANLSFCNSQTPYERRFLEGIGDENSIPCRVFSEEIPNCLEHGYLRDIVHNVLIEDLELVLFFTVSAIGYYYPKLLIKKVLAADYADIEIEEHSVDAHQRNSKAVKVGIVAGKAKVKDKIINVLILPHPSYRFGLTYKSKAVEKILDTLRIQDKPPHEK